MYFLRFLATVNSLSHWLHIKLASVFMLSFCIFKSILSWCNKTALVTIYFDFTFGRQFFPFFFCRTVVMKCKVRHRILFQFLFQYFCKPEISQILHHHHSNLEYLQILPSSLEILAASPPAPADLRDLQDLQISRIIVKSIIFLDWLEAEVFVFNLPSNQSSGISRATLSCSQSMDSINWMVEFGLYSWASPPRVYYQAKPSGSRTSSLICRFLELI